MSKATRHLLFLWRRPLLLILLLFCFSSVCVAWDDGGMHSAGVVREVPRKGQRSEQAYTVATPQRQLIRIVTSTKDLEDDKKYCAKENHVLNNIYGVEVQCAHQEVIEVEAIVKLKNEIIPAAVKLHADRLLVDRESTPLIVPPFQEDSVCGHLTVPPEHHKTGVPDADFVLYVAAKLGESFGAYCATSSSGRPIAGGLNFVPYRAVSPRLSVRHAAHHIGHALGFNYKLMKELGMTTTITVRGVPRVIVKSEMTKKKAQEHYGCDKLEGMELDYKSQNKNVSSTWSWRNAKDELMSSSYIFAGGYYTALTMATFHDMQFYSANWGMEEPMSWGNKTGCNFIQESCLTNGDTSNYPNEFCTGKRVYCSTDHFALSVCHPDPDNINMDSNGRCPVLYSPFSFHANGTIRSFSCTELGNSGFPGFLTGVNSMCLSTDDYDLQDGIVTLNMSSVCAQVLCDESNRKVQVKYMGNDNWHDCPEGTSITVSSSVSLNFTKITCPNYTQVCTIAFNGNSRFTVNDPSDGTPAPSTQPSSGSAPSTQPSSGSAPSMQPSSGPSPSTQPPSGPAPSSPASSSTSAESAVPGVSNSPSVTAGGVDSSSSAQNQWNGVQELSREKAAVNHNALPVPPPASSNNQINLLEGQNEVVRSVGMDGCSAVYSLSHALLLVLILAVTTSL